LGRATTQIALWIFVSLATGNLSQAQSALPPSGTRWLTLRSWPDPPNEIHVPKATDVTYEQLSRVPRNYANSIIALKGRVIQSIDSGGKDVIMRINVTPSEDFRRWTDTVYVEYHRDDDQGGSRVIEGDVIEILGEFAGIKSYQTVLGATVQVPFIRSNYGTIDTEMTRRLKVAN
jgi:hypothetical protein